MGKRHAPLSRKTQRQLSKTQSIQPIVNQATPCSHLIRVNHTSLYHNPRFLPIGIVVESDPMAEKKKEKKKKRKNPIDCWGNRLGFLLLNK